MGSARIVLTLLVAATPAGVLVSGGSAADPRTPPALPGEPPPFLGTAVVGEGGLTAAVDAYGDVVDLRVPGPAGRTLIDIPSSRQTAGTVPPGSGVVPWVSFRGRPARPLWTADSVEQGYRRGTNVLATTARFGRKRVRILYAADRRRLACLVEDGGARVELRSSEFGAERRLHCGDAVAQATVRAAGRGDRAWLRRARPLAPAAPAWAQELYQRSLLVLRALTNRRNGGVAAGARDGWAYVWPRDAAATTLALAAAGYRAEARRSARFLHGLDLRTAARFYGNGEPVPGRGPQGDAAGWAAAATRAVGLPPPPPMSWRNLPDYQEGEPGDFLGNAIAADGTNTVLYGPESSRRLVRRLGDSDSGLDSAAAWAVEPFRLRPLYPAARETMRQLVRRGGRFGITPGEGWRGGRDPWSAPTAWTAWSLAALAHEGSGSRRAAEDRRLALRLLGDLRRAATPAGMLPERVDFRTGIPTSTTPLAWSHAFAILALRQLWPG
jgi:Glycosyl hydrolases family 15